MVSVVLLKEVLECNDVEEEVDHDVNTNKLYNVYKKTIDKLLLYHHMKSILRRRKRKEKKKNKD
jgi:uncharacterized protein YqgQ